jgi:hypothetical protein
MDAVMDAGLRKSRHTSIYWIAGRFPKAGNRFPDSLIVLHEVA